MLLYVYICIYSVKAWLFRPPCSYWSYYYVCIQLRRGFPSPTSSMASRRTKAQRSLNHSSHRALHGQLPNPTSSMASMHVILAAASQTCTRCGWFCRCRLCKPFIKSYSYKNHRHRHRHHGQKKVRKCMKKGLRNGPGGGPKGVQKGSGRSLGGVWAALGGQERAPDDFYRISIFFDFFEALLGAQNGAHSDQN